MSTGELVFCVTSPNKKFISDHFACWFQSETPTLHTRTEGRKPLEEKRGSKRGFGIHGPCSQKRSQNQVRGDPVEIELRSPLNY